MNCYFKVHWLIVQCTTHESSSNLRSGCQVQNMSSFYPGLSYKYLFMAYKNPRAAREQAIFLKRFKWQIKFVNQKTRSADEEKGQFIFNSLRVCSTYIKWNWVRVEMISSFYWVENPERESTHWMYLDTFQSGKRIVGLLLKCIKCFPNASFEIFRCFVGLAVFGREHGSLLLPSSVHWGTLRWWDTQINTNTKANTNTLRDSPLLGHTAA